MSSFTLVRSIGWNYKTPEAMAKAFEMLGRDASVVAAVLAGKPRKDVAKDYKISLARVHELMVWAGFNDGDPKNADRDKAIIDTLDSGRSVKEVADAAGLSVRRVELIALGGDCQPLPTRRAKPSE